VIRSGRLPSYERALVSEDAKEGCRPSPRSGRRCSRGDDEIERSTHVQREIQGVTRRRGAAEQGRPHVAALAAIVPRFDRWTPCQAVARGGHIATIGLRPIAPGPPYDGPSRWGRVGLGNTKFKGDYILERTAVTPYV